VGHTLIFIYLLTYYFRFRSGTRVPVVLPGGYPGNKLPGYGSPTWDTGQKKCYSTSWQNNFRLKDLSTKL